MARIRRTFLRASAPAVLFLFAAVLASPASLADPVLPPNPAPCEGGDGDAMGGGTKWVDGLAKPTVDHGYWQVPILYHALEDKTLVAWGDQTGIHVCGIPWGDLCPPGVCVLRMPLNRTGVVVVVDSVTASLYWETNTLRAEIRVD